MSERASSPLLPRLVIGLIGVFIALTLVGWIIGAVLNALRFLALIAALIAVIWAIAAARGD